MAEPPIVTNEVVMEALRIKALVALADPARVTEADVEANLAQVDGSFTDDMIRRQVVLVALAFAFPGAQQLA